MVGGGVCGQANTCSVVSLYKMILQYNHMCPYHSFSLLVLQFALKWCANSSTLFIFSSILCVAISAIHPIIFIQDSNICIVYLYLYSYLYLCVFHLFYGGGDFIKFVISRVGGERDPVQLRFYQVSTLKSSEDSIHLSCRLTTLYNTT